MAIEVGQEAPDFTLKGPDNENVTLSSFRGQTNVVLVFFPLAFSGVCTTQLADIGRHESRYADSDARVLGISVDHHYAQKAFGDSLGLGATTLLADFEPKGAVAREYGVYMEDKGFSTRASFVIDRDGIVRHAVVNAPRDIPDEDAYFAALSVCNLN